MIAEKILERYFATVSLSLFMPENKPIESQKIYRAAGSINLRFISLLVFPCLSKMKRGEG